MKSTEKPRAVALGSFDGIHMGHIAVINAALDLEKDGLRPAVLLFDTHPRTAGGKAPPHIMTDSDRRAILEGMGVETRHISFLDIKDMSPEAFVRDVLAGEMSAGAVCCGYNYRFGAGASAGVEELAALCRRYALGLRVAARVDYDGEPVSSTRIRALIEGGGIAEANAMLGRAFSYKLTVVRGDGRGRLLGAPTANQLFPEGFVVPRFGVYASRAYVGGAAYPSVTNIGMRPTIGTRTVLSETHIIGFSGDLYGREVRVEPRRYLRGEKKFASLGELAAQIDEDKKMTGSGD